MFEILCYGTISTKYKVMQRKRKDIDTIRPILKFAILCKILYNKSMLSLSAKYSKPCVCSIPIHNIKNFGGNHYE